MLNFRLPQCLFQPISIAFQIANSLAGNFAKPFVGCLLSRVGDRPTATILHAQFHFFDFCLGFKKQNIRPKFALPRRTSYTLPPLQFTLYLPLLGGAYFGQIFCFKNPSKNQTNEILVQNYSRCLISISLL